MKVLVIGGAGYIGSHTAVELIKRGDSVIIVDDLSNSKEEALRRVEKITGTKIPFYKCDVADKDAMEKVFSENKIDSVVHFAGFKAVGESVAKPIMYYRNNINTTLTLYRFKKNGAGFIRYLREHTFKIIQGCETDIPDHRLKGFPVFGITGH